MCGFAGIISSDLNRHDDLCRIVDTMSATLQHRGPDSSGTWVETSLPLALGHRRLSIIDLSAEGHQPMCSADARYVITYNGEIYNFPQLRAELESAGCSCRGHSDTEVLLSAIVEYGLDSTLPKLNGMFAFVLWDRQQRILHLVRDRIGKKPLYFGWVKGSFVFGSELKALRAHPDFSNRINRDALTLYLRHNCIPTPHTIYQNIYKLPQGSCLKLPFDLAVRSSCYDDVSAEINNYWSASVVYEAGFENQLTLPGNDIADYLDTLLRDAVASRMISDVPLGAFLSGGIDSSLVVALMQAQSDRPVKTFTVGFEEAAHNEAEDAKCVAAHLGTEHHQLILSPRDVLDVVPKLPILYDEPFADSSQIPTYLVSKFAREQVTVALSGDGGDEFFGGYNRYIWAPEIWSKMVRWSSSLKTAVAVLLEAVPPQFWPRLMAVLNIDHRTPADKMAKLASVLKSSRPDDIYWTLVSHWDRPGDIVIDGSEPDTLLKDVSKIIEEYGFAEGMMLLDQLTYLHDDILVKVDRASMGVSLEARAPLLDYRIAEFAAQVPIGMKIKGRQGKYLLRKVLDRYVPRELIERAKMGFEMPISDWLRGPLKDWAEALLSEDRLRSDGYFYPGPIREKWMQHVAGKRNWQFHLWDILMFQAWLDEYR